MTLQCPKMQSELDLFSQLIRGGATLELQFLGSEFKSLLLYLLTYPPKALPVSAFDFVSAASYFVHFYFVLLEQLIPFSLGNHQDSCKARNIQKDWT